MKSTLLFLIALIPVLVFAEWQEIPIGKVVADSDLIMTGTLANISRAASANLIKCEGTLTPIEVLKGTPPKRIRLTWEISVPPESISVDHSGAEGIPLLWLLKEKPDGTYGAHYLKRLQPISRTERIRKIIESHNKAAAH